MGGEGHRPDQVCTDYVKRMDTAIARHKIVLPDRELACATRAFPAGSAEIPAAYREVGQPVFIPGSMGTSSFVLRGMPGSIERSFGSACHGAGRRMSRTGARRKITGAQLVAQLRPLGVVKG